MGAPNTLIRRSVPCLDHWDHQGKRSGCDWCGQKPRTLFSYGGDDRHAFCNLECAETFRGEPFGHDYIEYVSDD